METRARISSKFKIFPSWWSFQCFMVTNFVYLFLSLFPFLFIIVIFSIWTHFSPILSDRNSCIFHLLILQQHMMATNTPFNFHRILHTINLSLFILLLVRSQSTCLHPFISPFISPFRHNQFYLPIQYLNFLLQIILITHILLFKHFNFCILNCYLLVEPSNFSVVQIILILVFICRFQFVRLLVCHQKYTFFKFFYQRIIPTLVYTLIHCYIPIYNSIHALNNKFKFLHFDLQIYQLRFDL